MNKTNLEVMLKQKIRDVPDFPKPGIVFKDITTLIKNKTAFRQAIDTFVHHFRKQKIDKVVSMESRGFIFGSVVAYKLNAGFVPVRKKGKLPYKTISYTYKLEYGTDTLEIHRDAIQPGEKVLIIDDVLATGGTARAVANLITRLGGKIVSLAFLIELTFLPGKEKLQKFPVFTIIKY